ncbi:MAG: ABC transporter substrate-binding protein [Verrucomicrobiota bacterium]
MLRHLILLVLSCTLLRAEPAVRVVSQSVGTDELLLAVAAPEQIAALSHLSRDPVFSGVAEEAKAYPQIGYGDAETILRFRPTLVLVTDYSRAELVEQLRRAGVEVFVFNRYATLDDALYSLRLLADAIGDKSARARAGQTILNTRERASALARRLDGAEPVRVIAPSTYGVIAGRDTTFQDICEHAGATNLAVTLGNLTGHAAPPNERMLTWPVERVVLGGTDSNEALLPYLKLPPYAFMPAIREKRVALIEPWALGSVSHLRVRAYEQLARQLHPERFGDSAP